MINSCSTAVWSEDSIPLADLRRLNRVGSKRTLTVAGKTTVLFDRGPVPAEWEDCWMSGRLGHFPAPTFSWVTSLVTTHKHLQYKFQKALDFLVIVYPQKHLGLSGLHKHMSCKSMCVLKSGNLATLDFSLLLFVLLNTINQTLQPLLKKCSKMQVAVIS